MARKTAVHPGDARAIRLARRVARQLARQGAKAVVLVGSFVRGDSHRESDVDLIVIGRGSYYRLERLMPSKPTWKQLVGGSLELS